MFVFDLVMSIVMICLYFFFLMIRRPPRSTRTDTLFPYTTLFRSILHSVAKSFAGSMGGIYDYYAGLADTFAFEEPHTPSAGGEFGLLVREPVGVVAAIIPWNAPINLIANKLEIGRAHA